MRPNSYTDVGHLHTNSHLWAWVNGRLYTDEVHSTGYCHSAWLSSIGVQFVNVVVYGRIDHNEQTLSAVLNEPARIRQAEFALDRICDQYPQYDISKWGEFLQ